MKNPVIYVALLACICACNKDDDQPNPPTPPENKETIARITVYNATQWSSSQPYGSLTEGAAVSLYTSASTYPGSPAYTGTTNSTGEVNFKDVKAGSYFVVADKTYMHEKLSNLLFFANGAGGFSADSLWQATPGSGESPLPMYGAAGNFRFKDLNQDGVVNSNDRGTFPVVKITVAKDSTSQQKVLIGAMDNRVFLRLNSAAELNAAMMVAYAQLAAWHELQVTMDAVYTDDYDCTSLAGTWCSINGYTHNSSDNTIAKFWNNGFLLISSMGNIIANTELVSSLTDAEKKALTGQAKVIKAYVYAQLTNYFGSLPLQDYIMLPSTAARATQAETYTFITNLLTAAQADFLVAAPAATDKTKASQDVINALLARLYLQQNNFAQAKEYSQKVISTGSYKLNTGTTVYTQTSDKEIIWNVSPLLTTADAKKVFTKGTFLPQIRFAEVLLIRAEASVELGDAPNTLDYLNMVRSRAGEGILSTHDVPTLRDYVQADWAREMKSEGVRFQELVRWNKAQAVLGASGFNNDNRYLPIPTGFQSWYMNVVQNPGFQ